MKPFESAAMQNQSYHSDESSADSALEPALSPSISGMLMPSRRKLLATLGGLGVAGLWGCGGGDGDSALVTTPDTSTDTRSTVGGDGLTGSCVEVPSETAGPYPADGSLASRTNYNVLELDGIVRSDIRSNIDGSGGVQPGALLTLNIHLADAGSGCSDLSGYAIYIWHCTSEGDYSVYTEGSVTKNYLRGVQATDASGVAQFVTVMPGCYMGRVPHIHVEVYPSLAQASTAQQSIKTTQLAFPEAVMQALYGTSSEYSSSVRAFNSIDFASDNVFSDGYEDQLVSISGDSANGYVATISIAVTT